MVMLLFYVGEERYACSCEPIVEIIPRLPLKPMMHAPAFLPGLVRYNGILVPVLDFVRLRDGRSCSESLSSRIIVVRDAETPEEDTHLLGLMAERVTEIIEQSPSSFTSQALSYKNAPYLGGVLGDELGLIQAVDVVQLFPLVHDVMNEVQARG